MSRLAPLVPLLSVGKGSVPRLYFPLRSYSSQEKTDPYTKLRPLISTFKAPVDWAVAYGSGVLPQASSAPKNQVEEKKEAPLTDLLLSTPNAEEFHSINLRQNPTHYPLYARLLGAKSVARIQEKWGAGVWYVTMVDIGGTNAKYGIITSSTLEDDLKDWTTFYLSGRLQKPTLLLQPPPPSLEAALQTNLQSALSLSLLLLPREFTEDELWMKITGLSYEGDPRMRVPGGENPGKVGNIVRGPGAREGFREMYGPFLQRGDLGVEWAEEKKGKWTWKGTGEGKLVQHKDPKHMAYLASTLPSNLVFHLPSSPSSPETFLPLVTKPSFPTDLSKTLNEIIHTPALRQSVKGLFTAGLTKSVVYTGKKVGKWFKGRK
ncbi:hypothetical protein L198_00447 [Cryptococcus wingfieldii CBS 7118]|uniref:Phosphatidate cytidylyltransferase, mitochondrial n=1 Tax=Cryptococcus wingfieldii CBS 7118 TaxID=1295528 RepID=A0A1E3K6A7_9TREE|nr:hypothetical protein L198_00447 [Cryptococcus wingfieldii CBS 7118]ODO08714.1 hypothetical protein L198_00447 [Cryptococcus wingfieldii CBS 7118]